MTPEQVIRGAELIEWVKKCKTWIAKASKSRPNDFFRADAIEEIVDYGENGGEHHYFIFVSRKKLIAVVQEQLEEAEKELRQLGIR